MCLVSQHNIWLCTFFSVVLLFTITSFIWRKTHCGTVGTVAQTSDVSCTSSRLTTFAGVLRERARAFSPFRYEFNQMIWYGPQDSSRYSTRFGYQRFEFSRLSRISIAYMSFCGFVCVYVVALAIKQIQASSHKNRSVNF